jgi:hypothetical protein
MAQTLPAHQAFIIAAQREIPQVTGDFMSRLFQFMLCVLVGAIIGTSLLLSLPRSLSPVAGFSHGAARRSGSRATADVRIRAISNSDSSHGEAA